MRSAQRRAKSEKLMVNSRKIKIFLKLIVPAIVVLFIFLFLKITTRYWDGKNKVSFVYQTTSGDVAVTVLDPLLIEKTTLIVPGNTEINVAHGYGTLSIKNVWQLGINEKLGGKLLAETVTNNFLFPLTLWSSIDIGDSLKFIFNPKITNIPFGDRVHMVLFSLKVKSIDSTVIDLGKNQFLKKQTLVDGSSGYVMNGPVSGRLTVYFSDNNFVSENLRFSLIDQTGSYGVVNGVGSILEVLGGKVASLEKLASDPNLDCVVNGKNYDAVKKIAILFGCQKTDIKTDFDLVMLMGVKFAKRF